MKLSAIFQENEFLGVVETSQVEKLTEEAGIKDYRQIDNVHIERRGDSRGEENVVYWGAYDEIDDLQGGSGNAVIKND